jgi:tetratricopeptide (TPR) repeat protein
LPFESFINIFVDYPRGFLDKFIEIHKVGEPNANHFLISRLIKEGYVSEVLTTNFDTFLEDALRTDGAKASIFWDEKQFIEFEKGKDISTFIGKIHGSVDNPSSMRFTFNTISQKTLLQSRFEFFSHFFDRVDRDIVFLGYSCSDEFDINIFIKKIQTSANIIYVRHTNDEDFVIKPLSYPFERYNGYTVVSNTNEIVRELCTEFGYKCQKNFNTKKWKPVMSNWCDSIPIGAKYYFLGRILSDMADTESSKAILEKGLKNAEEYERAHIENTLTRVALMESDYDSAKKHLQKSLPIFKRYNEKARVGESLFRLGQIEKRIGNYKDARKRFEETLNVCKEIDYSIGASRSLLEIGMLYRRTGNLEDAEEKYKESLAISEGIGDLYGISSSLHELGFVNRIKGNLDTAEGYLLRTLDIRTKMGNKHDLATSKGELALVLMRKHNYPSAQVLLDECLKLFEEIHDSYGISHALHEIGNLFFLKRDYNKAEQFYWKALGKKKAISDKEGIANAYGQIGNIRLMQGKKDDAKKYFTKCYKIHSEINNKIGMRSAKKFLEML